MHNVQCTGEYDVSQVNGANISRAAAGESQRYLTYQAIPTEEPIGDTTRGYQTVWAGSGEDDATAPGDP